MSLHEDVLREVRNTILAMQGADETFLSPSAVARAVYAIFRRDSDDEHVAYLAIEHIKQFARMELRGRFDADSQQNDSMQGDMFSGQLQMHYPIPVPKGEEPVYVRRDLLSTEQLDFNIASLRKSAAARLEHADALEAYRDMRKSSAVA